MRERGPSPESAIMACATFKSAFVDFATEYELAHGELEAAVTDAVSALEIPEAKRDFISRSKVEDLHTNVRDEVAGAFKDHHWMMNRAWKAFKQTMRETGG
jgi:hypothetical protein